MEIDGSGDASESGSGVKAPVEWRWQCGAVEACFREARFGCNDGERERAINQKDRIRKRLRP